jgi:hypothetical protein
MTLELSGPSSIRGLLRLWRLLKNVLRLRFLVVRLCGLKLLDQDCSSVRVIQSTFGEEFLIKGDFGVGIALRRFFRLDDDAREIVVAKQ